MAENNNLLKEKAQLVANLKKMQNEMGTTEARLTKEYETQLKRLKEITKELQTITSETKKNTGFTSSLATELGGIYSKLDKSLEKQDKAFGSVVGKIVEMKANSNELNKPNQEAEKQIGKIRDAYSLVAEAQNELAQTSLDDIEKRAALNEQISIGQELIKEEVDALDKRTTLGKEFMSIQPELNAEMERRNTLAEKYSVLTDKEKKTLESQLKVFNKMTEKLGAFEESVITYLKKPLTAVGALVFAGGKFVDELAKVNKELGYGFDILNKTTASATALGFIFDNTGGTVKELAKEFGGVDAATFSAQANIGLISENMGISNTEAVSLSGSFARLNGGSKDIAFDMVKTTQEFAKQNGIIPAALMADLANSTEEFALFGKDGGENILRAAGYAKKLGVSMQTLTGVANNLLDFETSITKELELGAMLGKNISLDRARALAFEGKIEEATAETLKQLGGIDAFNKMDYFQKKASADLLGVSVSELSKMVSKQEKANSLGAVMNEKFSAAGEALDVGLNKYLGTGLKGLGGYITMAGKLDLGFKAMGGSIGGVVKGTGRVLKNLLKMTAGGVVKGLKSVGGALANSGIGKKIGGIKNKLFSGVGSKATKAATGSAGGAGIGGMMKGMGAGLKGLSKGVSAFASPQALLGLAAVTAAIIGIGFALKIAAPGIKAFGEAIGNIVVSIGTAVAKVFGGLGDFFMKVASVATPELALSVLGLAGGFAALTASLAGFAIAGIAAVPAMMAVSAFGAASSLLGLGDDGDKKEQSPQWAIDLEKAIRETKDVYMDATKVTGVVIDTAKKLGSNSYAITS